MNKKAVAYAIGCARLGSTPSGTLVVEDSASGIEAARLAGIQCVGLLGEGQALLGAAVGVDHLGRFAKPAVVRRLAACETAQEALRCMREVVGGGR